MPYFTSIHSYGTSTQTRSASRWALWWSRTRTRWRRSTRAWRSGSTASAPCASCPSRPLPRSHPRPPPIISHPLRVHHRPRRSPLRRSSRRPSSRARILPRRHLLRERRVPPRRSRSPLTEVAAARASRVRRSR